MTLQGYQFDKAKVTPEADAQVNSYLAQNFDNKIISGMTATSTGLNVYIASGKALVQGRLIENAQQMQLTAQTNKSGYVCITIDLTQNNTSTGTPGTSGYIPVNNQLRLELVDVLNQQDLNNGGLIYTFPLYSYVSTGSSVTLTKIVNTTYISTSFSIGYGLSVTAKRIGKLVTITFKGSNTTQLGSGANPAEMIPLGYRPVEAESLDFLVQGRHLDTYYYFNSNGSISYPGETIPVNSYFRGVRSYFTNDPWPA